MVEVEMKKMEINSEIPVTYHHINAGKDKPVLIFFHGYSDSGRSFLKRAFPHLDDRYEILAINGLFPVPQKKDNVWKQAYAWYFADFSTNSVLIHPDISAKAVHHLIQHLGLEQRKKILIGFSQGGFFLPFVFRYLKNVHYIFTVGSAYREEDYSEKLTIPLEALHGSDDEIISLEMAQKSFKKFVTKKNPFGKFHSFPGLKHTMNDEARKWLKNRIDEVLGD